MRRSRQSVSSGSEFEETGGYVRALRDGDFVFVSGTTGFDYASMTISGDLEEQVRQAVRNTEAALQKLGASLKDVVICNWVVTDRRHFPIAGALLKEIFTDSPPVMMTLVCDLVDARMLFELQVTAKCEPSEP